MTPCGTKRGSARKAERVAARPTRYQRMTDYDDERQERIDYKDAEKLRSLYWDEGHTLPEIAELADASTTTIWEWMKRHDIKRRKSGTALGEGGDSPDDPIEHTDEAVLRELYIDKGLSLKEISELSDVRHQTIRHHMKKNGIERRDKVSSSREKSRVEYAGVQMASNGYMYWNDYWGGRTRVAIHRLLSVSEYGFDEVADKAIHHKNGIRWDNRPENIQPMTPSEHAKHHTENGDFVMGDNSE